MDALDMESYDMACNRYGTIPVACYPCLSSSTHHTVCTEKLGLDLIKLNDNIILDYINNIQLYDANSSPEDTDYADNEEGDQYARPL